ncbi:type II secretion system minor pseudopilin GspI [Algibacillus agarilyticus]|uniref:type II secretion system minor pseudopilin GspI n=1 Tax=Algibacillus agarilyticus TaxID=2234133 RepID=UPI000DD01FE2|nr:type II secretion system minor pseudopilin GspI [Algibacillus agarilyticus]
MKLASTRGFTLLEILVAISILAVAGIALISSASSHLTSQSMLKQASFGQWVASNRLAEIKLEKKWPVENNKKGEMEMAGATYYWQQKVIKTQDESMVKVDVYIYESSEYQTSITSMGTYISKRN